MKTIKIKKLQLINFKGVKSLVINIISKAQFIFGDNGTGKTTIFDSFCWLLFGKDSSGRSDFEVKTLDSQNRVIEKIDHEVNCVLEVNGEDIFLRRVLKESWVKKRGSVTPTFAGNISEYYWNDVPVQQREFQSRISELIDEKLFMLLTNTAAFNSLNWKERRTILSNMVQVTDEEIVGNNTAFIKLMEQIKGQKSLEEFKKMKNASIKKAKEDLENIPTRIDEVTRLKPEPKDWAGIKKLIDSKTAEISNIDLQIQDKTKAVDAIVEKRNAHTLKVNGIKTKISSLENSIQNEANKQANQVSDEESKISSELQKSKSDLDSYNTQHTSLIRQYNTLIEEYKEKQQKMQTKREEWNMENSKIFVFDENECVCSQCKRAFEADAIASKKEEYLKNFNEAKTKKLEAISKEGQTLKSQSDEIKNQYNSKYENINEVKGKIESLNKLITDQTNALESSKNNTSKEQNDKKAEMIFETISTNNPELIELKKELAWLEKTTFENTSVDNTELNAQRKTISEEVDKLKADLLVEKQITEADERIEALKKQEQELAQQIADVENIIMTAEQFSKAKIDAIESKINLKFENIKFKMFEQQVNGGEAECCEATINGVPFSDANTASKINAGIDIINTLSEYYQVSAPIFVDNRESVVELLQTNSQVINLVVSSEDKVLRVA